MFQFDSKRLDVSLLNSQIANFYPQPKILKTQAQWTKSPKKQYEGVRFC